MPDRIPRPVEAGALAVPEADDAIVGGVVGPGRLLAAPDHGGSEFLIDPCGEGDVVGGHRRLVRAIGRVDGAERGSLIPGDEASGPLVSAGIGPYLVERPAHECLQPRQDHPAIFCVVPVAERVVVEIGHRRDHPSLRS